MVRFLNGANERIHILGLLDAVRAGIWIGTVTASEFEEWQAVWNVVSCKRLDNAT